MSLYPVKELFDMSVLGILTCEILELEFAHFLEVDKQLARITVLADERSACLLRALHSINSQNLKKIAGLNEFIPGSKDEMEVLVRVLELGLHNRKQTLQRGLVQAAQEFGPQVDALLLGYGLCGNALEKPDELLSDAGVPIFIPSETRKGTLKILSNTYHPAKVFLNSKKD